MGACSLGSGVCMGYEVLVPFKGSLTKASGVGSWDAWVLGTASGAGVLSLSKGGWNN